MSKMLRLTEAQLLAIAPARVRGPVAVDVATGPTPRVSGEAAGSSAAAAAGGNVKAARGRSKYKNAITVVDGITFHSRAEARRWSALRLMERAGEIRDIEMQVEYLLIPSQKKPGGGTERAIKYVCDFEYVRDGKRVIEDVKGMRTPDYIIKRKLMLHIFGIEVVEIKA
ncbi:MAG: DUF1064 domain-containing protein [Sphingobium sp.]